MPGLSVDVVTSGPPPSDPYDPGARSWALATGFAERGYSVRVLSPTRPGSEPPPDGVVAVPLPITAEYATTLRGRVDLGRSAGGLLRRDAAVVIRDPSGLGALGVGRGPHRPRMLSFVRTIEVAEYDRARSGEPPKGLGGKFSAWRDRRTLRALEREALGEADRLFVDAPELPPLLEREYGVRPGALGTLAMPVAKGPTLRPRPEARQALGIPPDVPVITALAAYGPSAAAGVDRVREAFGRIRPIFSGLRLVIAGSTSPSAPGVAAFPKRDRASLDLALAAADFAVFSPAVPGFDPGVVLALRAGVPILATPLLKLPAAPPGIVRLTSSDDAGEVASALLELLADVAERRDLAEHGKEYAARFDPATIVGDLETAGAIVAR